MQKLKMPEVMFCGAIGGLVSGVGYSDVANGSIALAHLFCLYREEYGFDNDYESDNYKTKLADLMIDYTEILLQYEKCFGNRITEDYKSEGISKFCNALRQFKKEKLKNEINELMKNTNDYTCRSWGNIAAARCYPIGYVARSLDESRFMTEEIAKNTHNNPDAIKGCKAVTDFIFLARCGWSKEAIKNWINCKYKVDNEPACGAYDMSKSCDDIKKSLKGLDFPFRAQAKNTVPAALASVFNADSFDKALENTESMGDERHVICSITAALAAVFWPIPEKHIEDVNGELSKLKKSRKAKIKIHIGQNYEEEIEDDVDFKEISKQFNKLREKLKDEIESFKWKVENTKSAIESLKTDLVNANPQKKQDILKLLDSIARDFVKEAVGAPIGNKCLNLRNELLEKIENLLDKYFKDDHEANDLVSFIKNNKVILDINAAPPLINTNDDKKLISTSLKVINSDNIKLGTDESQKGQKQLTTHMPTEIPDKRQGLWSKVCDVVKLSIVVLVSIAAIALAINELWWLFGASLFAGIVLFGICHFVQKKVINCSYKTESLVSEQPIQQVNAHNKEEENDKDENKEGGNRPNLSDDENKNQNKEQDKEQK